MNTRFAKWGNSLALRIPASFAQQIAVNEGVAADISVENGCLIVRPIHSRNYDLDELLNGIDEMNLHGETETGSARGNEFH